MGTWFYNFTCRYPVSLIPLFERLFSPIHIFSSFVKNQMVVAAWVYIGSPYSIP